MAVLNSKLFPETGVGSVSNPLIWRLFRPTRRKVTLVLAVLIPLGVIMQIWVTNRLSTSGERINQIERLKADVLLENQLLENQIAENSSLLLMKKYAAHLGFGPQKLTNYESLGE